MNFVKEMLCVSKHTFSIGAARFLRTLKNPSSLNVKGEIP